MDMYSSVKHRRNDRKKPPDSRSSSFPPEEDTVQRKRSSLSYCRRCLGIGVCLLLSSAVLFWAIPCPIDPVSYRYSTSGEPPCFTGAMEINDHLKKGVKLFENEIVGPEALAMDEEGHIFTGLADGRVIRIDRDFQSFTTIARTGAPPYDGCGSEAMEDHCGRPLGMVFNPENNDELYIADSSIGLLKLNVKTGHIETLFSIKSPTNKEGIPPIKFLNDLVVLDNGTIILTDSSKKFDRAQNRLDILEGRDNGQLLYFDPRDGKMGALRDGLFFPNGIALSLDKSYVLIVESTRARILRYYLRGPKVGSTDVFVDNLPAIPDNIAPSLSGGYWVGVGLVRNKMVDTLAEHLPFVRAAIAKFRLERLIQKLLPEHGLILELDESGHVIRSFHDVGGDCTHSTSHILELEDRLIIGSYSMPFLVQVNL